MAAASTSAAGAGRGPLGDDGVDLVGVLGPVGQGGEPRVRGQVGSVHRRAQPGEVGVAAGHEADVAAVAGGVVVERRRVGEAVALALPHDPEAVVAGDGPLEDPEHRAVEGGVDHGAPARGGRARVASVEGGQRRLRGEDAGEVVAGRRRRGAPAAGPGTRSGAAGRRSRCPCGRARAAGRRARPGRRPRCGRPPAGGRGRPGRGPTTRACRGGSSRTARRRGRRAGGTGPGPAACAGRASRSCGPAPRPPRTASSARPRCRRTGRCRA